MRNKCYQMQPWDTKEFAPATAEKKANEGGGNGGSSHHYSWSVAKERSSSFQNDGFFFLTMIGLQRLLSCTTVDEMEVVAKTFQIPAKESVGRFGVRNPSKASFPLSSPELPLRKRRE